MPELDLSQGAQHWANAILLWLGFGIVAGMLAKALLPGREPAGTLGTLVIGVVGSALGPFVLSCFLHREKFNPISPAGLMSAVGGSIFLLLSYRLFVIFRPLPVLDADEDEEEEEEEEEEEDAAAVD